MPMMIPYPYDWVGYWETEYDVKMSDEARAELIEHLEKMDKLSREYGQD